LARHAAEWAIADFMLPTGNGMGIPVYARAQLPFVRGIVMTTFGSEATRQPLRALDGSGFLSRSFNSQALLALLRGKASTDGHA
jgi:DNA-binding NarL/FixJ family response regulator